MREGRGPGVATPASDPSRLRSLIASVELPATARAEVAAQLSALDSQQRDRTLRLAVIGEFSSGKSLLINALMGEALLPPLRQVPGTSHAT